MGNLIHALWAKKEESNGEMKWLSLLQHLEDTSRVCGFLWNHWLCEGQRRIISGENDEESGRRIMIFLGAIHDLGKATPAFQIKTGNYRRSDLDYELLERLELAGAKGISDLRLADGRESPHSIAGETLLGRFEDRFTNPQDISSIVGGHHGRPTNWETIDKQLLAYKINYFQTETNNDPLWTLWEGTQRDILLWALKEAGFASASEIPVLSVPAQVQALGLLTMADWIASNTDYFPLFDIYSDEEIDTQSRYEMGVSKWFQTFGWSPDKSLESNQAFEHRFGFVPREVQKIFVDTIASCKQPGLFILEAPMGMGKTEAALMGAEELAAITGRKGVFFGLPTQATSNGIFPRIESWLASISQDDGVPNGLRLIHGKAHLNEKYAELTNASNVDGDSGGYEAFSINPWFSGKKTAILDDFVVGTVDQFLMVALKQKHLALRQLAFAKKVVIVDEVHAYDAYMSQYLQMALTWMASYRVPVILLSATLSAESRLALIRAYLMGMDVKTRKMLIDGVPFEEYLSSDAYPLISYTDGEKVRQVHDFPSVSGKEIIIQRIEDGQLAELIDYVFLDGGIIGIIVNTVKRAQELAMQLAVRYGEDRVELLHSSFLATERARKEADLMQMLGKGEACKRPQRKIVVGTQVIEQSLDIDFDVMISELAPVDLLIQRLGRLHRHERVRPKGCELPRLYLLGCSDQLEFDSGSLAVYGGYLLTRTQYFLNDKIRLPEDISPLVQAVYGKQGLELEEALEERYHKFEEEKETLTENKERKARNYRLSAPYQEVKRLHKLTLHNWLDNPSEDSSEETGNSQVRDADESIEVIALKRTGQGYSSLFGDQTDTDISSMISNTSQAMHIAGETLRLPRPLCTPYRIESTIRALEQIYLEYFRDWDQSSWLKGSLGILFDEKMDCRLNGYLLHYDRKYGLSYQKEEDAVGKV